MACFPRALLGVASIGATLAANLAALSTSQAPRGLPDDELRGQLSAQVALSDRVALASVKISDLKKCLGPAAGIVEHLVCPLSGELLREPVLAVDSGRAFESDWIENVPEDMRPRTVKDFATRKLMQALAEACPQVGVLTKVGTPKGTVQVPPLADAAPPPRAARWMDLHMLGQVLEGLHKDARENIKHALTDNAITHAMMRDPVTSIQSGHAFERQSILAWVIRQGKEPLPPFQPLSKNGLAPNRALRGVLWALDAALPPDQALDQALTALKDGATEAPARVKAVEALEKAWQAGLSESTEKTVAEALARALTEDSLDVPRRAALALENALSATDFSATFGEATKNTVAEALARALGGGGTGPLMNALSTADFSASLGEATKNAVAEALAQALRTGAWQVRIQAAAALGNALSGADFSASLGEATKKAVVEALQQALSWRETDDGVRAQAAWALEKVFSAAGFVAGLDILTSPWAAYLALAPLALAQALTEGGAEVPRRAALALEKAFSAAGFIASLGEMDIRWVAYALAHALTKKSLDADEQGQVRRWAAWALEKALSAADFIAGLGPDAKRTVAEDLAQALEKGQSGSQQVRGQAALALKKAFFVPGFIADVGKHPKGQDTKNLLAEALADVVERHHSAGEAARREVLLPAADALYRALSVTGFAAGLGRRTKEAVARSLRKALTKGGTKVQYLAAQLLDSALSHVDFAAGLRPKAKAKLAKALRTVLDGLAPEALAAPFATSALAALGGGFQEDVAPQAD